MRNTAAGISSLVALFFVIPPIMDLLPTSWSNNIGPYLPSNAGESFWGHPDGTHLSAGVGLPRALRVGRSRGRRRRRPADDARRLIVFLLLDATTADRSRVGGPSLRAPIGVGAPKRRVELIALNAA